MRVNVLTALPSGLARAFVLSGHDGRRARGAARPDGLESPWPGRRLS